MLEPAGDVLPVRLFLGACDGDAHHWCRIKVSGCFPRCRWRLAEWRQQLSAASALGIPAKAFWAVTLYNVTDGTMPETPQLLPSKNSLDTSIVKNSDGSVDLWFGPAKPADAPEQNWIQTIDGRAFMAVIRLYGADIEFFDQTWRPDDVVKLN
jgi:hypothetical protein